MSARGWGEPLSGLAGGASIVASPVREAGVKHVEFVALGHDQALAVLVGDDGSVENRLMPLKAGVTPSTLTEASNFLNARLKGRPLHEAQREVELPAEVGGFVPRERERHEALCFDFRIRAGEPAVQLVGRRSKFGVDGFGDLEGQGDHSCFGWLVVGW